MLSAIATTASSEKVYSPADLAATPTETKPAIVGEHGERSATQPEPPSS
jgi:hypothetical protein